MDLQTVLARAILLLLLLHPLLLGSRAHPLDSPSQVPKPSGIQELLDHLRDKVSRLEAEQMTQEPLQQSPGPTGKATPKGTAGPMDSALQTLRGLRSTKMMRDSGCFGRRLDRIGSVSGLGCNVLRRY